MRHLVPQRYIGKRVTLVMDSAEPNMDLGVKTTISRADVLGLMNDISSATPEGFQQALPNNPSAIWTRWADQAQDT